MIKNLLIKCVIVVSLSQPFVAHAQFESAPTPIWEGVEKSAEDIKNDRSFVEQALAATNGDRNAAAEQIIGLAWQMISESDPNEAVRRFNQAWLVKPDHAGIFWGFAVATHIRGDDLDKVERWFDEAGKIIKDNPQLFTDRGRVLEAREMPEPARIWFEKALTINPDHPPAHAGMMLIGKALDDKALEQKHRTRFEELTQKTAE